MLGGRYYGDMRCPNCKNDKSMHCLGENEQSNENAYCCLACDRLYLVTLTDVTDTLQNRGSFTMELIELEKLSKKLALQLAQVNSQIEVVRKESADTKKFVTARDSEPPA